MMNDEKCQRCGAYDSHVPDSMRDAYRIDGHRAVDVASMTLEDMAEIAARLQLALYLVLGGPEKHAREAIEDEASNLLVLACARIVGSDVCWHCTDDGYVFPSCVDDLGDRLIEVALAESTTVFDAIEGIADEEKREQWLREAKES